MQWSLDFSSIQKNCHTSWTMRNLVKPVPREGSPVDESVNRDFKLETRWQKALQHYCLRGRCIQQLPLQPATLDELFWQCLTRHVPFLLEWFLYIDDNGCRRDNVLSIATNWCGEVCGPAAALLTALCQEVTPRLALIALWLRPLSVRCAWMRLASKSGYLWNESRTLTCAP